MSTARHVVPAASDAVTETWRRVRARTVSLCGPLGPEDCTVQSMPDASPVKWHLAHTTWFFETFVLAPREPAYRPVHERYDFLFNSYYHTVGAMHARPGRGLLSRPTLAEVLDYRARVDERLERLLAPGADPGLTFLVTLGCHHEQQHQELILTDIKHAFSLNPMRPAYGDPPAPPHGAAPAMRFVERPGGIVEIGHAGGSFAFDNETPRHRVLLAPHALGSRLVGNAEYRAFVEDGGYRDPSLWLADGWSAAHEGGWSRPLYWSEDLEREFTLGGERPIDPAAPVVHLSYYEADAYARWAGARLPTEAELETAAAGRPVSGNFAESGLLHAAPAPGGEGIAQLYGDAWEWTSSAYAPYPGFRPLAGSLGEYNGKFMCGQMTLRGGSCATPVSHLRATYRNFFYPHQRWQFTGIRLAADGGAS